ncbi:hypothetical protein TVAG_062780 [Trichomonas vaginalis G3]|uniref:Uncharacterized protein n=1 Tax=Trichomonas vaginalis (strain ATCC PRA-98 / G3) TaxID=412133 RepID=A2DLP0_TRIV3|nr:armadillo (ARM) repeat-containing protein family [Trichomonas vaginalis G3]EAY18673.1 hypothetical protein TVAG_062780 [Trichomonas vaginalis G3]KAI5522572.1 armadillo (ARM) repeat-containing protein family [Trichomonas vaginalis G3]|eukprot:XP_001579659.1 hypothetical protein [Trichomonas vaginalis G3]
MILKSILPVYPEEINFLIELQLSDEPCFLRRLASHIFRGCDEKDDVENMMGLMEAFIVPLTSNIDIKEDILLIIHESNMVWNAFRYIVHIDCDDDSQWSALRFFEVCISHDFLHKDALDSVDIWDLTDFVEMSHSCEFEFKIHLIVIISNIIQYSGYDTAEAAIERDILSVISSFIPDHIRYALNVLDVLIKKYAEYDQGKTICDLIGKTSIIKDLKDATEDNDNDEEFKMIINFVNYFNNFVNDWVE